MELGLPRGLWFSQGYCELGQRKVAECGARDLGSSYTTFDGSPLFPKIQLRESNLYSRGCWESHEALTHQGTWQVTHSPCALSLASHLVEVWLAVADNAPFAQMMLHGLMGRLQLRFTPRANATSKADIWRLAAVDPLMVSLRGRPQGSLGGYE